MATVLPSAERETLAALFKVMNLDSQIVLDAYFEARQQRAVAHSEQLAAVGELAASIAHEVQAKLRELGGVTPPREFVLMDRAAIGLGSVFMHLKADVNWHRLFHDLIDDFEESKLAGRQKAMLDGDGVPLAD